MKRMLKLCRKFTPIIKRGAVLVVLLPILGGCYTHRERVVTVVDLQTNQPAAWRKISFINQQEIAYGSGAKNVDAILDENGQARMKLPTLALWVQLGQSGVVSQFDTTQSGEDLDGNDVIKGGIFTLSARKISPRYGFRLVPPNYRLEISKP